MVVIHVYLSPIEKQCENVISYIAFAYSAFVGCSFDSRNNVIWTCSNEWIDQYLNPAHQAVHHTHQRLQITEQQQHNSSQSG